MAPLDRRDRFARTAAAQPALAKHPTPTMLELVTKQTRFRPPRKIRKEGEEEDDSPEMNAVEGAAVVALGMSALTFARLRLRRVTAEKAIIKKLWEQHTTVRELRLDAEAA